MSDQLKDREQLGSTAYWTAAVRAGKSAREGGLFNDPWATALAGPLDQTLELAAAGSRIDFDIINSLTLTSPLTKSWVEMQAQAGAPWISSLDDLQGFLAERGWQTTLTPIGAPEANYGRWSLPVIPAQAPGLPHLWFVTGRKA